MTSYAYQIITVYSLTQKCAVLIENHTNMKTMKLSCVSTICYTNQSGCR